MKPLLNLIITMIFKFMVLSSLSSTFPETRFHYLTVVSCRAPSFNGFWLT